MLLSVEALPDKLSIGRLRDADDSEPGVHDSFKTRKQTKDYDAHLILYLSEFVNRKCPNRTRYGYMHFGLTDRASVECVGLTKGEEGSRGMRLLASCLCDTSVV